MQSASQKILKHNHTKSTTVYPPTPWGQQACEMMFSAQLPLLLSSQERPIAFQNDFKNGTENGSEPQMGLQWLS